ncbi:MAG TPA: arginine repressor [Firmicutes bacterium]|nr:arginine repressor [Candidatus Fermentithermobacillaceae bacterium]
MKTKRQMKILEIVSRRPVFTQEELAEALRQEGINVTQATISRDIKELNLIKVPSGDGRAKYGLPSGTPGKIILDKLKRLLADCCLSIDASGNLIVVKTISGTAPGVGEALDELRMPEILGTVAGDNTVLVVARSPDKVGYVLSKLKDLAGMGPV